MKKIIPVIIVMILILVIWEISIKIFSIPEYLIPRPLVIFTRLVENSPNLISHALVTAIEALGGFLIGGLFAIILAVIFVHSKTLEISIYPYTIALKTIPIVAIAPLLVVWFGNGLIPKVLVAALICFFPIVVNTVKGLKNIDIEAYDLFDSLSATKKQLFFKLRLPSAMPYIFSAFKISSTLSVIGAIVGEFSGADKGLGFFILISSYRLETVDMFTGIIVSSILGITLFYLVSFLERILVPWSKFTLEEI